MTHTIILAYELAHKVGYETLRNDYLTEMRVALWSIIVPIVEVNDTVS